MHIQAAIHPTATTRYQSSLVELNCSDTVYPLDMDLDALLRSIPQPSPLALDLLFIAACVYGIDKAVQREDETVSEDKWKRHLDVTVPVTEPDAWGSVADELADFLDFLTGDQWSFAFERANRALLQPRKVRRRRFRRTAYLAGDAVSLFSGGLDSYIGAIDFLAKNPKSNLALVGHYDGDIGGPGKDQDDLARRLEKEFPSRFTRLKCRVGLSRTGTEHSYRSRSFLFLALGVAAAESIGQAVPIIIPENGPIALNPPLIPSRRGACSTRTTHPHFLLSVESMLQHVGLAHAAQNPYKFSTKGEMVKDCRNPELLKQSYPASRSCAKAGYKMYWKNKKARQCGFCVPCLNRRAALHKVGWDNELFGNDVGDPDLCRDEMEKDAFADIRALTAFLFRNDSNDKISRDLLANGPIVSQDLNEYVAVITRMREEVRMWMAAKAMKLIQERAGLRVAP
jgi:hypothetical protein